MPIEGEINIDVGIENNNITFLKIASSRPSQITKLLTGKPIQQVENNLNLLYQLCNTAHRFSFFQLLNKSQVIKLSDNELLAYQLLLNIEIIKEHCFSIASKWHKSDTIDKGVVPVLATLNNIKQHLFSGADGLSLKDKQLNDFSAVAPFIDNLSKQLHSFLLDDDNMVLNNVNSFDAWVQNRKTNSAVFLQNLQQENLTNLGSTEVNFLPLLTAKEIGASLKDEDFIRKPHYQNITYESTPFSRMKTHPLVEKLGNGITGRYTAQLVEVFALSKKIKQDYVNIQSENIHYEMNITNISNSALVHVEAARGRLIHQANIKNNHIISYQILSPTQWNFHPQSVLNRMIKTLNFNDKDDLKYKIRLLVNALDPCVGFNIRVYDA